MDITTFHEQHNEVLALATAIEGHLDTAEIAANPVAVSAKLVQMFGKFSVHLAIEDRALYPRLAQASDPALRQMALRFEREMSGITERFEGYRKAWPGPRAISKDPARFVAETRELLAGLRNRIRRENEELYSLAAKAA